MQFRACKAHHVSSMSSSICKSCLLLFSFCCLWLVSHGADWRSCASSAAAFDIQAVTLNPEVVPPGGTLSLVVDVINKQPSITAGSATIKVYYYGWWVLTASGGMCEAPTAAAATTADLQAADKGNSLAIAHRRSLLRRDFSSQSWSSQTQLTVQPHLAATGSSSSSSSSSSSVQLTAAALRDDTCVMPQGPLQLHHDASLPAVAPRGNYRMQLSAADVNNGMELFCLDVWFKVAS